MNKKETKKNRNVPKVIVLVLSLIVIGVSGTYAFYTTAFEGNPTKTTAKAGVFKVTSSLEAVSAIHNNKIALIEESEKATKAEKLNFTVTSTNESTVNGQYNIYLKDIILSKNFYTSYFKWELLVNGAVKASGDFSNAIRSGDVTTGEATNEKTKVEDIKLNTEAIPLTKNSTDNVIFRMWMENDPKVNQIDLTEGSFSGRLYLEAFPVSELANSENN